MADGDRWQGRPAQPSAMQRAFDDATDRLAQRLEAESIAAPPPLRRPSRRMLTATPAPGRLEAAAAETSLDEARALMGTAWSNRLAALLPDGWRLGPCVGFGGGERFEPPCFDRLECTSLRGISKTTAGAGFSASDRTRIVDAQFGCFLVHNEGEGNVEHGQYGSGQRGKEGDSTFVLCPGEQLINMICIFPGRTRAGRRPTGLQFDTTARAGRSAPHFTVPRNSHDEHHSIIEAPPGLVIRNFYGRAQRHQSGDVETCCLGVVFGPPTAVVWRPGGTPVRFSDASTSRANAVLALASADRGPLSRLPEVLVRHVLGFAIALFGEWGDGKPTARHAPMGRDEGDSDSDTNWHLDQLQAAAACI